MEVSLAAGNVYIVELGDSGAVLEPNELGSDFTVTLQGTEIATSSGGDVANLSELQDVDTGNLNSATNRFVLIYDTVSSKFKFVNPDEVVDAAVGASVPGGAPAVSGLTQAAVDYLDETLDDKIDLDGGSW
tara:strand:+ start:4372 stop:4764 length:393 start_codon:yes stop_codon:yes gene_type:complete